MRAFARATVGRGVGRKDRLETTQPLLVRAPERPDPPEGSAQTQLQLVISLRVEVSERRADVVVLCFESIDPLVVLPPEMRFCLFCECQEVQGVTPPDLVALAG
jgi:hypothetical protein